MAVVSYGSCGYRFKGADMFGLRMPELVVIAIVFLVLFGGKKLPELGAGLGKSIRDFKKAMNGEDEAPASQAKAELTAGMHEVPATQTKPELTPKA